ncbi:MAG: DUF790 family protein, partial [Armatimonadetes bacterium]|nr:DUF790 family protein [Armatimonadota bacterium]
FDSSIEEAFADRWGDAPREGWTLVREGAILHRGQKVFVPDFVFRRDGWREVYLEIVGYWTPEYLEEKAKTLRLFADPPILLAIPESLGEAARPLSDPTRTVWFKSSLKIEPVLGLLRQRLSE